MQSSSIKRLRAALLRGLVLLPTPAVASCLCSTAAQACSILASTLPAEAFVAPNSTGYQKVQTSYWSETAGDLRPACITRPGSTEQVASIVKVLSTCGSDVRFAIKSGGHGSWPGWSSTEGGVLISLDLIDGVQNVADKGYAVVGSGARWVDVYKSLEPQGVTVIGGRFASIGVGGLIVGGGISYFTGLHGMACDNVLNYEVVLADGTIANVNQTSKPDLFRALKGGGNQFGIVTRFSLKTYKQTTQVWAGILTFSIEKASQVFNATQAFIDRYDPLSHMYLSMGGGSNPQLSFINAYVFYDASSPPAGEANPFAAFYAAKPIADTTYTQNYSALIASNNNGNTPQQRWLIGGHTFPNLVAPYGADLYLKQWQAFRDMANATAAGDQALLFSMALVPVPTRAMRAGENVTGVKNVLGLKPDAGDAVWIDYTLAWLEAKDDGKMFEFVERISKAGDKLATSFAPGVASTNAMQGAVTAKEVGFYRTNPRYMNYALLDQPVQSSYGKENEQFLQRVQKRYDPDGLWRKNGGFLWG
ncbi:Berberine/berberine-like [Fusarium oxysporum f. sp. vasinfectum]|uniref:FAD-binding PCMH-type domain-containing protein n=1 Tax=Fusarium oxysporum f. sp. vasinfectum 25433 TaxID=1089449 RepID=X0L8B4_FUSOX|nr:hypothetical protein FOTG_10342 [Fusarium oxysporum f. sp. vasinfectum 25433]KAK2670704.1 Berberine/berberine-like [Fusarium oxysporum f. sp. vasinfectum]KAK2927152.1 Berberine/berberine-like [Fusarium oxysporum f. sp. vasinfectum]